MNRARLVLPRPCVNEEEYIPLEILQEAEEVAVDLLPTKSRDAYRLRYNLFVDWCESRDIHNSVAEPVVLAYFRHIRNTENYAVSTLWNFFSKLKACIKAFRRVDISNYCQVKAYFKKLSEDYEPKQSLVLSALQVNEFLENAPEPRFLRAKAVLALGVSGCCRRHELVQLTLDRVADLQTCYVITIPKHMTKNKREKVFRVVGPFYDIVKRYLTARAHIENPRFFLSYRKSCGYIDQPAGKETIGAVPSDVATYLNLPEPYRYTSHCVRRSAATIYATTGITDLELQNFGKWKNLSSAQIYTVDTDFARDNAAAKITHAILPFSQANSSKTTTPKINKVKPRIVSVKTLHASDSQYCKPRMPNMKKNKTCTTVTSTNTADIESTTTTDIEIDIPNSNNNRSTSDRQELLELAIITDDQISNSTKVLPEGGIITNDKYANTYATKGKIITDDEYAKSDHLVESYDQIQCSTKVLPKNEEVTDDESTGHSHDVGSNSYATKCFQPKHERTPYERVPLIPCQKIAKIFSVIERETKHGFKYISTRYIYGSPSPPDNTGCLPVFRMANDNLSESEDDPYDLADVSMEYFQDFNSSQVSAKSSISVPFEELLEESNDEDNEPNIVNNNIHIEQSNITFQQADNSNAVNKASIQKVPTNPTLDLIAKHDVTSENETTPLGPQTNNDDIEEKEPTMVPSNRMYNNNPPSDATQHQIPNEDGNETRGTGHSNESSIDSENASMYSGSSSNNLHAEGGSEVMRIGRTSLKLIKCSNFQIHIHNHKRR
ncbi:hypothetical protein QAD02_007407 [Eretmocerus hayati]|uniref:Uncharacterized protein n=1 Tax=Eretmocerus hayati TaxID=131215 RepID=A0ACC2N7W7_9HYME|nr:hypothetical protein QAD02_007407 [Eretmocerus hayati]